MSAVRPEGDDGTADVAETSAEVAPRSAGGTRRWWRVVVPYVVTLFALVTLNFLLPRTMPGDPVQAQLSAGSTTYVYDDEARADLTAYYGLDRPLGAQYVHYLARLAHGDLGRSTANRTPVAKLVRSRLPWTLLLAGTGIAVATVIGVLGGVHAGWKRERRSDRGLVTAFVGIQNIPSYVLGSVALLLLAVQVQWLPLSGARTPFSSYGTFAAIGDVARHLLLPAAVVATEIAALQFLLTRSGMVSELGADYLVLGRVKGLKDRRLKYRYAARNALLPVVSSTAVQLGAAMTGTVFVERVFAYPGIGRLLYESIANRDYAVLQGCFLVVTVLVLTLNLGADLLYRRLDPRTR